MAYSGEGCDVTFQAASDFPQFRVVELTANPHEVDLAAANKGYGVVQNHPNSGEAATVRKDGVTKVIVGGAVSVGNYALSAASGFATAVVSGAAFGTSQKLLGRFLTAAASGGIATLDLEVQQFNATSGAALA